MDSVGDIIFWGAVVITVISQIAKSFKKAKPNTSTQSASGTVKAPQLINPPQKKEAVKPPPIKKRTPIGTSIVTKKEILVEEEEFEVIEQSEFNLSDLSEAKKAIIYSEILNRKY